MEYFVGELEFFSEDFTKKKINKDSLWFWFDEKFKCNLVHCSCILCVNSKNHRVKWRNFTFTKNYAKLFFHQRKWFHEIFFSWNWIFVFPHVMKKITTFSLETVHEKNKIVTLNWDMYNFKTPNFDLTKKSKVLLQWLLLFC